MIRELSKHPREKLVDFLENWRGRILFGSDIVTSNDHLSAEVDDDDQLGHTQIHERAFDLYASRYWALRTLLETDYTGESPIADPDLAMLNAQRYDAMSAPQLNGKCFPSSLLKPLLHDAAKNLLQPLEIAALRP